MVVLLPYSVRVQWLGICKDFERFKKVISDLSLIGKVRFRLDSTRETRERIVARNKLFKAWHSRERQALLFLIIKQKTSTTTMWGMVVIKVIGH